MLPSAKVRCQSRGQIFGSNLLRKGKSTLLSRRLVILHESANCFLVVAETLVATYPDKHV